MENGRKEEECLTQSPPRPPRAREESGEISTRMSRMPLRGLEWLGGGESPWMPHGNYGQSAVHSKPCNRRFRQETGALGGFWRGYSARGRGYLTVNPKSIKYHFAPSSGLSRDLSRPSHLFHLPSGRDQRPLGGGPSWRAERGQTPSAPISASPPPAGMREASRFALRCTRGNTNR